MRFFSFSLRGKKLAFRGKLAKVWGIFLVCLGGTRWRKNGDYCGRGAGLKGDATAQALYDFGMVGESFGKVALNLNGHTLTKTGESTFFLCHAKADAGMKDVRMLHPLDAASIADVQMQNVHFSADLATLTLTNVSFDEACSFSVGEEGRIVLSDAVVNISLPEEQGEGGIYTVDLSELFQCSVEGELTFSLDTEALLTAGYTGVQVDLGSAAAELEPTITPHRILPPPCGVFPRRGLF